MKSIDIKITDKEKRNQVLLCLDYKGLRVNVQGEFFKPRSLGSPSLALPLGELSPKVIERVFFARYIGLSSLLTLHHIILW